MRTRIKPNEVQKYLQDKPVAYVNGWIACDFGNPHHQVSNETKIQSLYDQGYGDCYANGESEPEEMKRREQ